MYKSKSHERMIWDYSLCRTMGQECQVQCGRKARTGKPGERREGNAIPSLGASRRGEAMKTILIVDDEPAARYGLRRALESKYRVAEAESAEAAREALPREKPDLVLLDV